MKTIKLGIIGCGNHAINHATCIKDVDNLELVAIFDPYTPAMCKLENQVGNKLVRCRSVKELLGCDIDAVLDSSPEDFHLTNLKDIINAGKHAFVEKPMILHESQLIDLEFLFQDAKKKNLVITSCHIRRFDPPYVWLKDQLDFLKKMLGNVITVDMDFSYHKPSAQWKAHRSLLADHANHEIDYINFLLGHSGFEVHKIYDSFDRYELVGFRYYDDISFKFTGTRKLDNHAFIETIRIKFDGGTVDINTKRGEYVIDNHEGDYSSDNSDPKKARKFFMYKTDYNARLIGVMDNFVKCINGKADNYLTEQDMIINNRICTVFQDENVKSFCFER